MRWNSRGRTCRSALAACFLLAGWVLSPGAPAAPAGGMAGGIVEVDLEADLSGVSLRQLEIIRLLVEAADIMGLLYQRQLAEGFYPADMTPEEFAAWDELAGLSPYTVVRRDPFGALEAVPYHEAWPRELGQVARLLARAADITNDEQLRHYLVLRARALITGDYRRAETAWLALQRSDIDVLIGPFGRSADARYGLKAAFGSWLLLRDWAWGARIARYAVFLPKLQESLPVSEGFRAEVPDLAMKLAVFDLIYHAGHGAQPAIGNNGWQDGGERRIRLGQGPRDLQLGNVTRARFEHLVAPVAATLLTPGQQERVSFEGYFLHALFRGMAHSLGLRETVNGRGSVEDALGEYAEALEEAKAAVLALWMVSWLHARGELEDGTPMDHQANFLAGLLRDVHVAADGPARQARLLLFNYFRDWDAIRHDSSTGRFYVSETGIQPAISAFAGHVLTLQGSGDREGAAALLESMAVLRPELAAALARLETAGVPADVVFRQDINLSGL